VTAGMVEGGVLLVADASRGERIRIISAREAAPHRRRRYHNDRPGMTANRLEVITEVWRDRPDGASVDQ
jgi:hypothetical protein